MIYDFNISQFVLNILPPRWRKVKHAGLVRAFLSPIQWLHDNFFSNYVDYDLSTVYVYYISGVVSAAIGDRFRFVDNTVWETQIYISDISTNNPIYNILNNPNSTDWVKILDDSIGLWERKQFNCQKMAFEYLLNRYFNPLLGPAIYINNNLITQLNFLVGVNSYNTSKVGVSNYYNFLGKPDQSYVGDFLLPSLFYNFTIFIQAAQFSTIDADPVKAEGIMRRIADKYNCAGMKYNIVAF